jgi:surface polysaccharide O-acyltransferase-like enzyme
VENVKKEPILYLDIIKIVACFLVIVNHSAGYIFKTASRSDAAITLIYSFIFLASKIAVPLFIMVSGALLLSSQKSSFKQSLMRIVRILVPLILLSLMVFVKNNGFSALLSFQFVIEFIRQPAILPYWYLYMLIGLYLATPFLQKMIKTFDDKDFIFFSAIFLLLPGIWYVIRQYSGIYSSHYFESSFIPQAIAYFVLGYFLSRKKASPKTSLFALLLLILSLITATALMFIDSYRSGKLVSNLDNAYSITTIIPAAAIFILIRYWTERIAPGIRPRCISIIQTVASTTFGIYLIHYFVIPRLYNLSFLQPVFIFHSVIGTTILQLATFIVCFIPVFLLKKAPIVKRFL